MILSVLMSSIVLSIISGETTFAQSDDDSDGNNNVIGQDGDGDEASQSDEKSQNSDPNSMCVSGESVSLSCNNLASKNIGGTNGADSLDPFSLRSIADNVYNVTGETVRAGSSDYVTATANCEIGDTVISGGFDITTGYQFFGVTDIKDGPTSDLNGWQVVLRAGHNLAVQFAANAVCFDNP